MQPATTHDDDIEPTLAPGDILVDELDGTRFEARALIGRGGMGEVYRATRLSDGASCALKCVRGDLLRHPTILLRTRFEAKAFRQINHPNVVRIHGTGVRADNVPWMAMEWLEGFTLAQILEKRGRVPLRWAIEIVRDLCRGLRAIHEYAIHRDIKPSNVHFGLDGVTRALDLGAAKSKERNVHLTSTGFQVGTLPFMAPEQLDNTMEIDHRADLWAATVVLYMLMTGVHPFAVDGNLPANKIKLGFSILTDPHRPLLSALPTVPPFFAQFIDRGLAKDPDDRHRSAEELAQVLTAALDYLEATTGHAEPLSSLVYQLVDEVEAVVANPPQLLWRPAPPIVHAVPASPPRAAPVLQSRTPPSGPRGTQPMRAPSPAALQRAAAALPLERGEPRELAHASGTRVAVPRDEPVAGGPAPAAANVERKRGERVGEGGVGRYLFPAADVSARPRAAPPARVNPETIPETSPPKRGRRSRWTVVALVCAGCALVITAGGAIYRFRPRPSSTAAPPITVPAPAVLDERHPPSGGATVAAPSPPDPTPAALPLATVRPVAPRAPAAGPVVRRPPDAASATPAPAAPTPSSSRMFGVEP